VGQMLVSLTPMCKVKFQSCPGIRLESKPVSYSRFPAQVVQLTMNLGANRKNLDAM